MFEIGHALGNCHIKMTTDNPSTLFDLTDFAARENPKRSFLFVSKVLGKHIPVKPSEMRRTYMRLVAQVGQNMNDETITYVVGMAETATGLGAGVADQLARTFDQETVIYQHTTRQDLPGREPWIVSTESHSHATDQLMYKPNPDLFDDVQNATRLVLVDDEITTGRTLSELCVHLLPQLSNVKEVILCSILNWGDDETLNKMAKDLMLDFKVSVKRVSLHSGQFSFEKMTDEAISFPDNVSSGLNPLPCRNDIGRIGIRMPFNLQGANDFPGMVHIGDMSSTRKIRVVGTEEHLYLPFLYAELLEANGFDVIFQSTTRSPILKGNAIKRKIEFNKHSDGSVSYLYNFDEISHIPAIIMYETDSMRADSGLNDLIKHHSSKEVA